MAQVNAFTDDKMAQSHMHVHRHLTLSLKSKQGQAARKTGLVANSEKPQQYMQVTGLAGSSITKLNVFELESKCASLRSPGTTVNPHSERDLSRDEQVGIA